MKNKTDKQIYDEYFFKGSGIYKKQYEMIEQMPEDLRRKIINIIAYRIFYDFIMELRNENNK